MAETLDDRFFETFLDSEPMLWTVSDLAYALDVTVKDVQAAVDRLVAEDELVKVDEADGHARYDIRQE